MPHDIVDNRELHLADAVLVREAAETLVERSGIEARKAADFPAEPARHRHDVGGGTAFDLGDLQALTLVFGVAVIAINLLTDLAYAELDPRVRL